MKLTNTLFATVAMLALAGPAFAQTLVVGPSTSSADVTTNVANACAITGTLSAFLMTVTPNGVITAPSAQPITVTCNTPSGTITIGSNDMVNLGAPAIVATEAATFTNTLKFIGQADGSMGGPWWRVDSRDSTIDWSSGTIGLTDQRRIRILNVSVVGATAAGKLPVAGDYTGRICVTVDPSGLLPTTMNNTVTCAV